MSKKIKTISVKHVQIGVLQTEAQEYISLTHIASFKNPKAPKDVVKNWLRNRSSIEYLGLWERINNPNFKGVEFDSFLFEAGSNSFTLSPSKWIEATNAIGIISKQGRGGGTYAQKDIAFEFASWISAEFKLYLIKEYQRLKEEESNRLKLEWNYQRHLTKVNYYIHTDAIKGNLVPENLSKQQINFVYANEADVLNMVLFGKTAKQWREEHLNEKGNIRDMASIEQLVVLSNLESLNAVFIDQGLSQSDRLQKLNDIAISQMSSLVKHNTNKN
ncbi:MAG: KilA-N domain-containing protein [Candidatus Marinimicrobia bacterium]|nr:KilA-N domain-containing protein [Candidatus Neomarinimicrobiota bacterium]